MEHIPLVVQEGVPDGKQAAYLGFTEIT